MSKTTDTKPKSKSSGTMIFLLVSISIPVVGIVTSLFVEDDMGSFLLCISLAAICVLVLSLAFSKMAGFLARSNRNILFYVFRPGLLFTQLSAAALVVLSAITTILSVYLIEATLIHRVHFILLGLVGLAAGGATLRVLAVSFLPIRAHETKVFGKLLLKKDYPHFWSFIEAIAKDLNTVVPANIVGGYDPNFFVTEAPVRCIDGALTGRTLYVSIPFCRVLSTMELAAICGHEFAHFIGQDTRFSRKFFPIYRGSIETYQILQANVSMSNGLQAIAFLPSLFLVTNFFNAFNTVESEISRTRELEADRIGAKLSSADDMASALVKIHAFSKTWAYTSQQMKEALVQGKMLTNAADFFQNISSKIDQKTLLDGLGNSRTAHPTDSHPPLAIRLEALKKPFEEVAALDVAKVPQKPASGIIDNIAKLEVELSDLEHLKITQQEGIKIPA